MCRAVLATRPARDQYAAAAQPHVGRLCDQHRGHAPDRRNSGVREDGEVAAKGPRRKITKTTPCKVGMEPERITLIALFSAWPNSPAACGFRAQNRDRAGHRRSGGPSLPG